MSRILSININGVKAFYNRGVLPDLLNKYNPDIVALQETKASETDTYYWLSDHAGDYLIVSNESKGKRGYAGVAFMVKKSFIGSNPITIEKPEIDSDDEDFMYYATGRVITIKINGFTIINTYVLNSGSGKEDYRSYYNTWFKNYIKRFESDNLIVCGDFNVCHKEIDQYNWNNAYDTAPGLYEFEIDDFSELMDKNKLFDSFRELHPTEKKYTWFAYQSKGTFPDKGWRLDYFLVNNMSFVKNSEILYDKVSDHYPILLDYD